MKKSVAISIYVILTIVILTMIICASLKGESTTIIQNGCYVCYTHDHYVVFKGNDSPEKQQRALDELGCRVYAVLLFCNPNNFSSRIYIDVLREK